MASTEKKANTINPQKTSKKHKREDIVSEYVLETRNLGITFGGLKAVQDVNLKIKKNFSRSRTKKITIITFLSVSIDCMASDCC
jgi:plastocyanin domain-containing protein